MTEIERNVLGTLMLFAEENDALMAAQLGRSFPSDDSRRVQFAIRVLHSKDLDVNVLTVYEYLQKRGDPMTLESLTECVQSSALLNEALAYLGQMGIESEDDGGDWVSLGGAE